MRTIIILIVSGRYAVLDAKRAMGRGLIAILGAGFCAPLITYSINQTIRYDSLSTTFLIVFTVFYHLLLTRSIDDKLEDVIHILLEEEGEEMYHPPYDIELPEDED